MASVSSYQNEENLRQVVWEFLPGILKFLSFIALIAILIVGGQSFLNATDTAENYAFAPNLVRDSTAVYGKLDAEITVVLATDFQCPACAYYDPIFRKVEEEFKDRVRFAHKDYPIERIHPYALAAAKGAQAANMQGKFIEYSDLAFSKQEDLNNKGGNAVAEWGPQISGLDVEKWNRDRNSLETEKQIRFSQRDLEDISLPESPNSRGESKPSGQSLGTPTTIIMKGEQVLDWWTGALDEATLRQAIEAQLNK